MGVDYGKGLAVPGSQIPGTPPLPPLPPLPPEPGTSETALAYSSTAEGMAADQAHAEKMARLQAELDAAAAAGDYQRQLELLKLQQQFEREQEDRRREEERQARQEQLKQERLKTYTDLLGNDPVRAVLYALGLGGETTGLPQEQFAGMEPLAGAQQKKTETEQALNESLMKYGATTSSQRPPGSSAPYTPISPGVTLGNEGVQGLTSVQKAGRALIQGDEDTKKLLGSAYGVGNKQTGGKSIEEIMRLAEEVKPRGVLDY